MEYLESIVAHGLRPEGVYGNIARKYDRGWVSFEKNPPTDWLTRNLHRLKFDPPSCRTFALEFDEARIKDEFEVKEFPREVANDLCPAFFPTEAAVLHHVGITVGHVLSSGVNCRCDSPRNMDFRVSSDRLMHVGSSGTCSASVGRLNARAMVLSVGATA